MNNGTGFKGGGGGGRGERGLGSSPGDGTRRMRKKISLQEEEQGGRKD